MTAGLSGRMPFDSDAVREQLRPLTPGVHLAACSIAPRSGIIEQAMTSMFTAMSAPGTWPAFEERTAFARARFAALIGADTDQIAVQPNASTAAFQVASSLRWRRRRTIITTAAEFPGVAHVWLAQRVHGAEVLFVGERDGDVTGQDYLDAIDASTALVSVPAVTYRDGRRLPVAQITAAAHAAGARVFVDAYQAAGVEPIDVAALGCDYLVAGTGKYLLGLPGVAFLYLHEPTDADQRPQLTGWQGHADPHAFDPLNMRYPATARRYEAGTPAIPALYAAAGGLKLINSLDLRAVRRHISDLAGYAAQQLQADGEVLRLAEDPRDRGAHLALLDHDAEHLARWLGTRNTVVAPRTGVVRLALHAYSNRGDVDTVCEQIREYRSTSARAGHRPAILAAAR